MTHTRLLARPARWLHGLHGFLFRQRLSSVREDPLAALTNSEAAILRDLGFTAEEFVAASAAEEGKLGRPGERVRRAGANSECLSELAGQHVQRRLGAILSADIAGYSHHIASDDRGAVGRLTEIRRIATEEFDDHRGALVDAAGDSCLGLFFSVTDAVTCAVDLQRRLAVMNELKPAGSRMELRIGIHLGDLLVRGHEAFGESINIAARLQAEAQPGGICLSAASRELVASTMTLVCEDLGEIPLKNIDRPVHSYRVVPGVTRPN